MEKWNTMKNTSQDNTFQILEKSCFIAEFENEDKPFYIANWSGDQ